MKFSHHVCIFSEDILCIFNSNKLLIISYFASIAIYGGFARNCVAKTMEDNLENEYIVTDENGCATDPTIFGEWQQDHETQSLMASFNAFKFPSSDNIRFQCNIRVCFGRCQPVNIYLIIIIIFYAIHPNEINKIYLIIIKYQF